MNLRNTSSYSLQPTASCSAPHSRSSRFNYGGKLAHSSERRSIRNFKTLSPITPTWRPSELVKLNTHVSPPLHVQTSIFRIRAPRHLYSTQHFKVTFNSFCLLHKAGDNLVTRRKLRCHLNTFIRIVT